MESAARLGDVQRRYGHGAKAGRRLPQLPGQVRSRTVNIPDQMSRRIQAGLAAECFERYVFQRHADAAGIQAVAAQAGGHTVAQRHQAGADLFPAHQVIGEGSAVAHGLDRIGGVAGLDGTFVKAVGVFPQLAAHLSQQLLGHGGIAGGQLTDGFYTVFFQGLGGGAAGIQQVAQRLRPNDILPPVYRNDRCSVRFFHIAAQLGKHFIERNSHRNR